MKFTPFPILPEVILIEPDVHKDGEYPTLDIISENELPSLSEPQAFGRANAVYRAAP